MAQAALARNAPQRTAPSQLMPPAVAARPVPPQAPPPPAPHVQVFRPMPTDKKEETPKPSADEGMVLNSPTPSEDRPSTPAKREGDESGTEFARARTPDPAVKPVTPAPDQDRENPPNRRPQTRIAYRALPGINDSNGFEDLAVPLDSESFRLRLMGCDDPEYIQLGVNMRTENRGSNELYILSGSKDMALFRISDHKVQFRWLNAPGPSEHKHFAQALRSCILSVEPESTSIANHNIVLREPKSINSELHLGHRDYFLKEEVFWSFGRRLAITSCDPSDAEQFPIQKKQTDDTETRRRFEIRGYKEVYLDVKLIRATIGSEKSLKTGNKIVLELIPANPDQAFNDLASSIQEYKNSLELSNQQNPNTRDQQTGQEIGAINRFLRVASTRTKHSDRPHFLETLDSTIGRINGIAKTVPFVKYRSSLKLSIDLENAKTKKRLKSPFDIKITSYIESTQVDFVHLQAGNRREAEDAP
jgi:hypothetical protein